MTPGVAQRVLGLSGPPDASELRQAWRRFALRNHPDRIPTDPSAGERFQLGRVAFEVLRERVETRSRPGPGFVPLGAAVPRATREWLA